MYNISKEIIWLVNLLLWNDKQAPLEEEHIFQKNGIDLVNYSEDVANIKANKPIKAMEFLIQKSRGYISFLRGENPFTFPLKLEPENKFLYTPNPKFKTESKKWVLLKEDEKIHQNNIRFYKNSLSKWQYHKLKEYLVTTDESDIEPSSKIQSSFSRQPLQASNIVYPQCNLKIDNDPELLGELKGNIGEKKGLEGAFDYDNATHKYTYKNQSGVNLGSIDGTGKGFLHIDYVGKYSKKQESIMSNIITSKGIVFVYSQFISHGIKPMALTLEENGFKRFIGDGKKDNFLDKKIDKKDCFCSYHKKYYRDLTSEEQKNFKQATYIYLDGQLKKKNLDQLVREVRGQAIDSNGIPIKNDNGEHVMVILGSRVIEQSIEEGKNGMKSTFLEGVFMQAENKNKNGRIYTREVLTKAVDKFVNEQVITGRAVGELNHPDGPSINLDKVSHRITELKWDGNNVMGKALILDTPMGQIVKGLVEGGVQLGVSSRGMGSLAMKNGVNYVADDFMLNTVDIVQDPSAPNAYVNGIMEGVSYEMDRPGHFVKVIDEGETEVKESKVKFSEEQQSAGFEHFLSKL